MLEGCTPRQGLDSLDTSTASTSLDTGLDTWITTADYDLGIYDSQCLSLRASRPTRK
jgi:hypothetical protein